MFPETPILILAVSCFLEILLNVNAPSPRILHPMLLNS